MGNIDYIISKDEPILITGSNGFIGTRVVKCLIDYGFTNLRCFTRPSSNIDRLNDILSSSKNTNFNITKGNLLSRKDCSNVTNGVSVIIHLAAGIEKSFPGSYLNSVLTTRNLLDASLKNAYLKRFLNVSSFSVYSNMQNKRHSLLDESCDVEIFPEKRFEPYCFGKIKQDELLVNYNKHYGIPYVIVRPGAVFGPGKNSITARVGIDTFGIFLHLGGSNIIPFTYVDNCAEAIVLASLRKGINGEVFNVVDDELPTSKKFLKMYKKNVKKFRSVSINYRFFYFLCFLWEWYSNYSKGQLPPAFNRRRCAAYWKGNIYSNKKLKTLLGWEPKISFKEATDIYFNSLKNTGV